MRNTALALLLTSVAVFAESHAAYTVTLGYLTEHSDLVVVATAGPEARPGRVAFTVTGVLRGALDGAAIVVARRDGEAAYAVGTRILAFLRRDGDIWRPLSRTFGMRPVPDDGPASRFPGIVRAIAGTLGEGLEVAAPDGLRTLLVAGMADPDAGIAWSAAMDFVRHESLHAALTAEQRTRILDAYRGRPVGKDTKHALAHAVAVTKDPGAAELLISSLRDPRAREIRVAVGAALRRLADPAASRHVVEFLKTARPAQRADGLTVLGFLGTKEAALAARDHLGDAVREVRVTAAHVLGLAARALRARDPEADVAIDGQDRLEQLLKNAAHENEMRAALWALAQLDRPAAYDVLRAAAANDPRETVRRYAARYLRRPRQSLLLR